MTSRPDILEKGVCGERLTRGERGGSLLELLIALLIFGVMVAEAVPQYMKLGGSFERMNARSNLLQDLKRAQAQTLTTGCRGIFKINLAGTGYNFGCDYLPYDTDGDPSADSISFSRTLPNGITVSSEGQIIFDSRGYAVDSEGVVSSISITLYSSRDGTTEPYLSGTLLGTGLFSVN